MVNPRLMALRPNTGSSSPEDINSGHNEETIMDLTVKRWFAGEYTATSSPATGFCPHRECGHAHRSQSTARRCAAAHYPWIVYAEMSDGRIVHGHEAK